MQVSQWAPIRRQWCQINKVDLGHAHIKMTPGLILKSQDEENQREGSGMFLPTLWVAPKQIFLI